jgi:hypothetical protein
MKTVLQMAGWELSSRQLGERGKHPATGTCSARIDDFIPAVRHAEKPDSDIFCPKVRRLVYNDK